MEYLLLAVLWIAWCAIHSGMISLAVTGLLKRRLGSRFRFYRLAFNLVAAATLVAVVLYAQSVDGRELFRWEGGLVAVQVLLLTTAAVLFLAGMRQYDLLQFLGLRQIRTGAAHTVLTETGSLNTSGILGVTRHPWYLAAILLIWSDYRSFSAATLVTNGVLTAYLIVGTILEERKLLVEFGQEYRDYQARASMLVPLKWLKSRFRRPTG